MKNKLLLPAAVVVLWCALPIISLAQTSANAGDNGNIIQQEIKAEQNSIKTSVDQRRQNAIAAIIDRINQFTDNIVIRYEAAVNRLDILAGRIDSRIVKMETQHVDVAKAKELLATAKTDIETARTSVEDIASTTSDTSFGTTTSAVRENFNAIKTQMEKAKEDLKTAQASLLLVVDNLKSATSTASSTNN